VGIIYTSGTVSNGEVSEEIRFLVDSGATYSMLPMPVWKKLGLKPKRELEFTLADGTLIKRSVSECRITILDGEGHTPVILGENQEDEALLGAVTLEEFGFVLDPFKREIRPAKMLLYSIK
jgi:clan AA aspartic protease